MIYPDQDNLVSVTGMVLQLAPGEVKIITKDHSLFGCGRTASQFAGISVGRQVRLTCVYTRARGYTVTTVKAASAASAVKTLSGFRDGRRAGRRHAPDPRPRLRLRLHDPARRPSQSHRSRRPSHSHCGRRRLRHKRDGDRAPVGQPVDARQRDAQLTARSISGTASSHREVAATEKTEGRATRSLHEEQHSGSFRSRALADHPVGENFSSASTGGTSTSSLGLGRMRPQRRLGYCCARSMA